jgi:hypothetical protein
MSGQLESQHFLRRGDRVRNLDGRGGYVEESWSLYAAVVWDDGAREEVDQFDPRVTVVQRGEVD